MSVAIEVRTGHLAIAAEFADRPDDWPVAPRFHPARRWYHRLATLPDHEVWLLTWLPGQATDLHDHGGSAGAFVVVSGELAEETVASPASLVARQLPSGAGRSFGAGHVHRVGNRGVTPAVSVHVYGPALRTMTRYRVGPAGLEAVGVDRAGADW